MDDPPGSRLFVVCGKSAEQEVLQTAFEPYGNIQNVKVIRDKGVAYVKFDKASSAAHAMENLNGAVLNNGRGPKLKVLLAESPNARNSPQTRQQLELELACDPDNMPPRSRLFLVVPKTADGQAIKNEMSKYPDMDYCKTDLIQSKGVVFCKYSKASSALSAMEEIRDSGMLAGYKVKCMLAEPKSKRARLDGLMPNGYGPGIQTQLDFGMGGLHLTNPHTARPVPGLTGIAGLGGVGALTSMANMNMGAGNLSSMAGLKVDGPLSPQANSARLGSIGIGGVGAPVAGYVYNTGNSLGRTGTSMGMTEAQTGIFNVGDISNYTAIQDAGLSPSGSPPALSRQRLFVVVYKGVSEEMLARLFRRFPGMEYCDLKKDKRTGKSKGYCYVNYSTHEAASSAVQHLNGIEFPPHSGHRLKVMFAEPLGVRGGAGVTSVPSLSFSSPTYESARRFQNSSQGEGELSAFEDCESSIQNGTAYNSDFTGGNGFTDEVIDETKVFTALTRPMPDYALEHEFGKIGAIEYVKLMKDKRLAVIKYTSVEAARNAVQLLNGTELVGETLHVSAVPIQPGLSARSAMGP